MPERDLVTTILDRFRDVAAEYESDADAMDGYGNARTAIALRKSAARLRDECDAVTTDCETLTVDAWASLHGASPTTVRSWIHRGELAAQKLGSGEWAIRRTAARSVRSTSRLSASLTDAHARKRAAREHATHSPETT